MGNQMLNFNSKNTNYAQNPGFSSGNFRNVPIQGGAPFPNNGLYQGNPGTTGFSGGYGYPPGNYQQIGYSSHS